MVKFGDNIRITNVEISELAKGVLALSNRQQELDVLSQRLSDTQLQIIREAFIACTNISQQQRDILIERQKIDDTLNNLMNKNIMITYGV